MTDETPHLTAEDVAAFLDRRMTAAERAGAEAHLADCRECRAEIADVRRLVSATPARRSMVLVPAALAAAAVIAFVALSLGRAGSDSSADRVRTPGVSVAEDSQRIAVIAPAEGDTIRGARASLLWSAVVGEPTYRLTLTDASGQPVWTTTTSDTSLTLPANVALQPHTKYFWYVDAQRADGRAASTGVRSFTTP